MMDRHDPRQDNRNIDSREPVDSRLDDARTMLKVKDAELGRMDRGLANVIGQIEPSLEKLGY